MTARVKREKNAISDRKNQTRQECDQKPDATRMRSVIAKARHEKNAISDRKVRREDSGT